MDYLGPEPADFINVQSLNDAFLRCLRISPGGASIRQQLTPALRLMIEGLTELHIRRLAAAPFLLFSLRERDAAYWRFLSDDNRNGDLFAGARPPSDVRDIVIAALGFLWQLARRNPYAVRLISGATLNWCEQLAECTFLHLMQRGSARSDLLQLRFADNGDFWKKMLCAGLSSEQNVRSAAHLAAMQTLLTTESAEAAICVRAAACRAPALPLRVAEEVERIPIDK